MENRNYKYNAFISYRHSDLDKYVAENLQRLIETYKMPKAIIEKYSITDNNFRRVFRDQDELPLSSSLEDPIIEALKESEFLLVICSPRLNESKWCKKEIENFIKFHGRDHILCVLVEGEPNESFPEILKYKEEKVVSKNGKERTKKVPCEPLAMDVRGNDNKEIYQKLKSEFIRAIAPMYNLDYDDIKRRHEERELKRKGNILKTITFASLVFAIYSFILFSNIYSSNKQLKYDQSINLANEAHELLENDDRIEAVHKAYQSITEFNGNSMPITSQGLYELTDSLGIYYTNRYIYPISELKTNGKVDSIKTNGNKNYLLSYDSSGDITLWNLEKELKIKSFSQTAEYFQSDDFDFVGNDKFAYINDKYEVIIVDLEGNIVNKLPCEENIYTIVSSINGKYIAAETGKSVVIYDVNNNKAIATYTTSKNENVDLIKSFDPQEENLIFSLNEEGKIGNSDYLKIITYNIKKRQVVNTLKIDASNMVEMIFNNNDLIFLAKTYYNVFKQDAYVVKYNYKNGKIDYQKKYSKASARLLAINVNDNNNKTILFISDQYSYLFNYDTGNLIKKYTGGFDLVTIDSLNSDYYSFNTDGVLVSIKTGESDENDLYDKVGWTGTFNCHLTNPRGFIRTKYGFLAYNPNDNRIVMYDGFKNDLKEIEYEPKKRKSFSLDETKKIVSEYNYQKRSFIRSAFLDTSNKYLFIVYTDNMVEIYDKSNKKLIKELEIPTVSIIDFAYYATTESGNYIFGSVYGGTGYILNKNFELIAQIPNLVDYQDGKIILEDIYYPKSKYYEVKLYSEDEIIGIAKEYLDSKKDYLSNN